MNKNDVFRWQWIQNKIHIFNKKNTWIKPFKKQKEKFYIMENKKDCGKSHGIIGLEVCMHPVNAYPANTESD